VIIDLHNHTIPLSRDSSLQPINLIKKISSLGIDGVCLTEHDAAWDSGELQHIAADQGVVVIPGMEITTEVGHILAFGLDRYRPEMARMRRLCEIAATEGAALVLAHPYRSSIYSLSGFPGSTVPNLGFDFDIHGVEIFNGQGCQADSRFSAGVAESLNLSGTGGSDAHTLLEVGESVTQFEDPVYDLAALLNALRSGRMTGMRYDGKEDGR